MGLLVEAILRWIYRHFLSLLLIIAVLIFGGILKEEFEKYKLLNSDLSILRSGKQRVDDYFRVTEIETIRRVVKLKSAPLKALNSRIENIERDIQLKRTEQQKAKNIVALLSSRPLETAFIDAATLDIEIGILQQEWEYLDYLRALITGPTALEQLRQSHVIAYRALKANEFSQEHLESNFPIAIHIPGTFPHGQLANLLALHPNLLADNQRAYASYEHKRKWMEAVKARKSEFVLLEGKLAQSLQPIYAAIREGESNLLDNWFGKITRPVMDVLPTALQILIFIILVPIGIKAIFYFVLAPLASRRPPICLLPDESGIVESSGSEINIGNDKTKLSLVSMKIEIEKGEVLLIHPEYLQSSAITGKKDTKWLLDYSYPWSSLLSGMFALTRISADRQESIVLSATKDPLSEIGVISLPTDSAIVLQPRCLIGVAYEKEHPARISRHWRLFSLHAWLTLQLRYLVFHGPSKLILKGCRGVRLERACEGRRINQAATIGFSASLNYSTSRCETFSAYLMGKKELLNDSFNGKVGYYIYEEMPHYGKRSGITGRGLEGLTDSVLKILGI